MIDPAKLAEWEGLAEKATVGPWEANRWRVCAWPRGHIDVVVDTAWNNQTRTPQNEANAAFIAASREALPALIARVRELESALEKALRLAGDTANRLRDDAVEVRRLQAENAELRRET